jgi:poly-gamma-glutamate synthesis protein (capsule biosynthesis protein)
MMRVALGGDAMLGRGVADRLREVGPDKLFAVELRDALGPVDLFLVNLECCVSERGTPWPQPGKPFFFRAPPAAAQALAWLGVDCVSLANNHALDFGAEALADTPVHLAGAGIRTVGAGPDSAHAREPLLLEVGGARVAVVAVTDHPADYAAGPDSPGVAYAELRGGLPEWLGELVRTLRREADIVIVSPHWGPNMTSAPMPYVRRAAAALRECGATLVAGHSAHVFHGVAEGVLFDLGDLIDDYIVDSLLRNDLSLIMVATVDGSGWRRLEAVPVALDYAFTRLTFPEEYRRVRDRFSQACEALGSTVVDEGDRLVVTH